MFIDHGNSSRSHAGSGANPPSGHTLAPQPVKSGVRGRGWTRRTSVSSAARLPNAGRKIQDADCRLSGAFCRDRRRGEIQDPMIPVAGKATTGQTSVVRLRIGSWRNQRSRAFAPRVFTCPACRSRAGGRKLAGEGLPLPQREPGDSPPNEAPGSPSPVSPLPDKHLPVFIQRGERTLSAGNRSGQRGSSPRLLGGNVRQSLLTELVFFNRPGLVAELELRTSREILQVVLEVVRRGEGLTPDTHLAA